MKSRLHILVILLVFFASAGPALASMADELGLPQIQAKAEPWCAMSQNSTLSCELAQPWERDRPPHCGATCFTGDGVSEEHSAKAVSQVAEVCLMKQPSVEYDICKRLADSGLFTNEEIAAQFSSE